MSVRLQLLNGGQVVAEHLVVDPIWHYKLADDPNRPARFDAIHLAVPPTADPGLADVYRDELAGLVPNVGSVWIWEPCSSAREVVQVTGTKWNGEEWWVASVKQDVLGNAIGKESWNELGRWMEACIFLRADDAQVINREPRAHVLDMSAIGDSDRFVTMRRLAEAGGVNGWTLRLLNLMIEVFQEHETRLGLLRLRGPEQPVAPWVVRDEQTGEPVTLAPEEQMRQMEVEMADMRRALTEAYGYRHEAEKAVAARKAAEAAVEVAIEGLRDMAADANTLVQEEGSILLSKVKDAAGIHEEDEDE